jgi:putative SOS response-associated peptidase YedK
MCGRYVLAVEIDEIASLFNATPTQAVEERYRPSWNIPPSTDVVAVRTGDSGRVLDTYRWGLVPSWAEDPSIGNRFANARAESVATKPSFRSAFRQHRVGIVAEGYLEWRTGPGKAKEPFYFQPRAGGLLVFAGLYETWCDPRSGADRQSPLRTCAIITTEANEDVAMVHTRMPAILSPDVLDVWLDPENDDYDELEALLRPLPSGLLKFRRVDRRIGSVVNDDSTLLESTEAEPSVANEQASLF